MRRHLFVVTLFLFLLAPSVNLFAQNYLYATGTPTFTTAWPERLGFVNISNGNIHLEIPLAGNAQRGSMALNERLVYDSRIWQITDTSSYQWQPTNVANSMAGWRLVTGAEGGTLSFETVTVSGTCGPARTDPCTQRFVFFWTDPGGTQHTFIGPTTDRTATLCTSGCTTGYSSAIDASGYQLKYVNRRSTAAATNVYDPNGNQIYPTMQDANGNAWSKDANGNLVDTLGHTPVITTTSGNTIAYSVLSYNGIRQNYTVTTESIPVTTAFAQSAVSEFSGTLTAIQSITLPDGTAYSFTYDTGTASGHYGELTGVTLPQGGTITYGYTNYLDSYQNMNRWLASRTDMDGLTSFTPAVLSVCSSGGTGCKEHVLVTRPDHSAVNYILTLNNGSWNSQMDEYVLSGSSSVLLRSTVPTYDFTHACSYAVACTGADYVSKTSQTITLEDAASGAITQQTQYTTDLNSGKPLTTKQWDYYLATSSPPASPAVETDNVYGYLVNNAALLTQSTTKDGAGTQVSQTTYSYDETTGTGHAALAVTSGLPQHNAVSGNRGNLTTTSQWINTHGGLLSTYASYDDAGVVQNSTDPNGLTTYGHDASDTFVTSITPPTPSSGIQLVSSATTDASTGLPLTSTDPNGSKTVYANYDSLNRLKEIDQQDGSGNLIGKTTYSYSANQMGIQTYQSAAINEDTEVLYDGLGRVSRTAVYNGQGSNPWYQTDTCYDSSGRLSFRSTAYQGTGWGTPQVCSSTGTATTYDALGRAATITDADGVYQVTSAGRATKTVDVNGVQKITQSDAFGRIAAVCEISSNSSMPGSGSPQNCGMDIAGTGFLTSYSYDLANHRTTLVQGAQQRVFTTDSLGRKVDSVEPERGETKYGYAYNTTGLVLTRQRPTSNQTSASASTTTTTQYDVLGRTLSVIYSDSTPTKTFAYDTNAAWQWSNFPVTNLKGRLYLAGVSGADTVYSYDALGRVSSMDECLPSGCGNATYDKQLLYRYDWAGNVGSSTDGAGVATTYNFSLANELTLMTNSLNDAQHPATIISAVQNGPNGPTSYSLGNGLTSVHRYDSLGRVNGGWACSGSTSINCAGGSQVYGFTADQKGVRTFDECDTVLNQCLGFGYDEFNRLNSQTTSTGATVNLAWTYDRYGNRWTQSPTSGSAPAPSFSFNAATNQISTLAYDAAGNMTSDGTHTYIYDAEGNVTKVDGGSTAQYTYDALNQRVSTTVGSAVEEFVFNASGQRVSVWNGSTHAQIQGQYYWGSKPVAYYASGVTHFQHQDWLGTERLRTTYNGAVEGKFVSLPFGDAKSTVGIDGDPSHFAMLDSDAESGTDHAGFRQYSNIQARWMSPDPYDGSMDIGNPQSLNRYAYAGNMPKGYKDPRGLDPIFTFYVDVFVGGGEVDPLQDVLAGGLLALDVVGDALFGGLFAQPQFHGSLRPRPNARQCIGSNCGKPDPHPNDAQNNGTPVHGPWTYGNFCGAGGSGTPINGTDAACQQHDACYTNGRFSPMSNFGSPNPGLQSCNQALCNAVNQRIAQGVRNANTPGTPEYNYIMQNGYHPGPLQLEMNAAMDIRNYFTYVVRGGNACQSQ